MNDNFELGKKIVQDPEFKCPVCGSSMYITDHGNHELTFHCSSQAARFWDFERGTSEQMIAKEHYDQSKREMFLNLEDAMNFVLMGESILTNK
jgi:hypothetical protein